ncbi:MAG TPA: hypothetical protein VFQ28_09880 [Gaiella sp.]|nr:hypothetical protein [Gaiella sp.]
MTTRTATLAAAFAVLLLAVAAVASGCGSSSTDDGVAALDDAPASTTGDGDGDGTQDGAASDEDPQEAALAWASCMREHGVDVPDPQVGEDGRVEIRPGTGMRLDRNGDDFREAREACGTPFGDSDPPQLSEEEREELQETMLEFAKCMREHGVDMPDPDFSGGGGIFRAGGPGSGIDPGSATFQKAQEACQDILEDAMPGGGLRVGGPPTGGAS